MKHFMEDFAAYQIRIRGQVEADDLNTASPLQLTVQHADQNVTIITVHTDQAGVIGLMRHLHGLGFLLLSVMRDAQPN
jgi:hypothetical protein